MSGRRVIPWVVLAIVSCLILESPLWAQQVNETPGSQTDDIVAAYFAPCGYRGKNMAVKRYLWSVCSGTRPNSGQQYEKIGFQNTREPTTNHRRQGECTVASFYELIQKSEIQTLFLYGHGGKNGAFVVEMFPRTAGLAPKDDPFYKIMLEKLRTYTTRSDNNMPTFEFGVDLVIGQNMATTEQGQNNKDRWYGIAITGEFLRKYSKLNNALVFNGACFSASLSNDWLASGARVTVGFTPNGPSLSPEIIQKAAKEFFWNMDGKSGIDFRNVQNAASAISNNLPELIVDGNASTTLSPAVLDVYAPCPLQVGDVVTYTFDTACRTDLIGDIQGNGCQITDEVWRNPTTLEGKCSQVNNSNRCIYTLTLKWNTIRSKNNGSYLDGNTNPIPINNIARNAKGPSRDDHYYEMNCEADCEGDYNGNNSVDIGDILYVLDDWNNTGIDCLLCTLAAWSNECLVGACCLNDYCIPDVSEDCCISAEGTYLGDESFCDDLTCSVTGACCWYDSCDDAYTESECEYEGGEYFGVGSSCENLDCWARPTGSCCHADQTCTSDVTAEECTGTDDRFREGDTCDYCDETYVFGACCTDTDSGLECTDINQLECIAIGGFFLGEEITCGEVSECAPLAICCIPGTSPSDWTVCVESATAEWCEDAEGTWYQDETCETIGDLCERSTIGACCIGVSSHYCENMNQYDCEFGCEGTWYEATFCSEVLNEDEVCVAPGVCCLTIGDGPPDSECWFSVNQESCWDWGGTYWPGKTCDDIQCICPIGEYHDCYGNCFPGSWLGDGTCQNGTMYNGVPIYLNCIELYCDHWDCDSTQCEYESGICCTAGYCWDNMTEALCIGGHHGIFYPDATCADNSDLCQQGGGACCYPPDGCVDYMSEYGCIYEVNWPDGGTYYPGMTCAEVSSTCNPALGACCLATSCIMTDMQDCLDQDGFYQGDLTDCDYPGCNETAACCVPTIGSRTEIDMLCFDSTEVDRDWCELYSGTWVSGFTCLDIPCDSGACCIGDGQCIDGLTYSYCVTNGGTFHPTQGCLEVNCP